MASKAPQIDESRAAATLDRIEVLTDEEFFREISWPVNIHSWLFEGTGSEGHRIAGTVRDRPAIVPTLLEGHVVRPVKLMHPDKLQAALEISSRLLRSVKDRYSKDEPIVNELAAYTSIFFSAHPFYDGNGRTYRTIIRAFCNRFEYPLSDEWTVHSRPYDRHFLYAYRHWGSNPHLLSGALRAFFPSPVKPLSNSPSFRSGDICDHCLALPLTEQTACIAHCANPDSAGGGGGGGTDDDVQEWFDWLYSYLSQT